MYAQISFGIEEKEHKRKLEKKKQLESLKEHKKKVTYLNFQIFDAHYGRNKRSWQESPSWPSRPGGSKLLMRPLGKIWLNFPVPASTHRMVPRMHFQASLRPVQTTLIVHQRIAMLPHPTPSTLPKPLLTRV
jgi:hypothetical protein